jgi:hypothetical protein
MLHDARSQLAALSDVCSAAQRALQCPIGPTSQRPEVHIRVLYEVFFQPYSGYLHRALVATLRSLTAIEALKDASNAAIYQCISEQQQQWEAWQASPNSALTHIPMAAAWASASSCAMQIPATSTCAALKVLSEQIQAVLEQSQSQSAVAPLQAELAHDLQVRNFLLGMFLFSADEG